MHNLIEVSSQLHAPCDEVWKSISTMCGVNHELWPWLRMTHPPTLQRLDQQSVPLNQRLFRSWILLLGVLPVEFDDVGFEQLAAGSGFVEVSRMLSMREWRHERRLASTPDQGCLLTDQLTFEPRIPGTAPIARRLVRSLFEHRHRRLRKQFGWGPPGNDSPVTGLP